MPFVVTKYIDALKINTLCNRVVKLPGFFLPGSKKPSKKLFCGGNFVISTNWAIYLRNDQNMALTIERRSKNIEITASF